MSRILRVAVIGALALSAVGLATACSNDNSDDDGAVALVAAINFLDASGFHGIDESINDDGEIPASAASTARKAQAVMDLAEWPDEFDDEADALEDIFAALATELEKDEPDMAAAGEQATRAHDGLHDFSAALWSYLRAEAGQQVAGSGDGHN